MGQTRNQLAQIVRVPDLPPAEGAACPAPGPRRVAVHRARSFVHRHKPFCAVVFALYVIGGIAATAHEARVARAERDRAVQRFDEVRKIANSFLFDVDLAIEKLPDARPARALVAQKALAFLDNLSKDTGGDLSLLRDLAAGYERVAARQGVAGVPSLCRAICIRESVARAAPYSVADVLALAAAYDEYAGLALNNDSVLQHDYKRKALEIRERLYAAHPHDVEANRALGRGYWEHSNPLCATADYQACLEWRMRALHLYDEAAFADPSARNRHTVGMMHKSIAAPLQKLRDFDHALEHSREAIAIDEALAAADPLNAAARRDLSFSYESAAESLLHLGRPEEALEYARKTLDIREQLAAADPADTDLHSAVGSAAALVGDAHLKLGRKFDAAPYFRKSIALFARIPNQSAELRRVRMQLAKAR
jgi:non-specific serine/threonine protein kinase/serine/threonine-protein kinase